MVRTRTRDYDGLCKMRLGLGGSACSPCTEMKINLPIGGSFGVFFLHQRYNDSFGWMDGWIDSSLPQHS